MGFCFYSTHKQLSILFYTEFVLKKAACTELYRVWHHIMPLWLQYEQLTLEQNIRARLYIREVVTHLSRVSNSLASHATGNKFILMHWVFTVLGPELGLRNTEMDKMSFVLCHLSQPVQTADQGIQLWNQVAWTCSGPNSHSPRSAFHCWSDGLL